MSNRQSSTNSLGTLAAADLWPDASSLGFCTDRLQRVLDLIQGFIDSDRIAAACLGIGRHDRILTPAAFGNMRLDSDDAPVLDDTIFLIASPTKPVTCVAVMMLLERGLLTLDQRAQLIIPELTDDKKDIRLVHLLTHTSGLPDMVPDNLELRAAKEPLSTFVERTCNGAVDFPVGTKVQYQSTGILLLAEIVQRITGTTLQTFLADEVFAPLGMKDSFLGRRDEDPNRISDCRVPTDSRFSDWNWNSDYWHRLGAPWGGMFSTVTDYCRFLQMMLNGGSLDGVRILSPASVDLMVRNQLPSMPVLEEAELLANRWGLGWMKPRLGWSQYFGDILSPRAFGHGGATGTTVWADPDTGLFCSCFTNQPGIERELAMISNAVASSFIR